MKNLAENNLIRFISITKKKDGIFANFKVKGIRGGTAFSASITVDLTAVNVNIEEDPFRKIVEECEKTALKEFRKTEFQSQGLDI